MSNMDFPFNDDPQAAAITCRHVLHEGAPILYVSHDSDDGMWQFLCGDKHRPGDAKLIGLSEAYELDNSLAAIAQLPLGCSAERKYAGDNWALRAE